MKGRGKSCGLTDQIEGLLKSREQTSLEFGASLQEDLGGNPLGSWMVELDHLYNFYRRVLKTEY